MKKANKATYIIISDMFMHVPERMHAYTHIAPSIIYETIIFSTVNASIKLLSTNKL